MFETNVLGLMRMTRGLLPRLVASGDGHVVNVDSIVVKPRAQADAFRTHREGP